MTNAEAFEETAELAAVLAAGLRAGLTPPRVLEMAGVTGEDDLLRVNAGGLLGACWDVAIETGAAPAELLQRMSDIFSHTAQSLRQAQMQVVGPQATIRLVVWLPAISILCAQLVGVPVLETLFTTVVGWVLFILGVGLLVMATLWLRLLVRRAQSLSWARGFAPDVMAMVLRITASPSAAAGFLEAVPREGYSNAESWREDQDSCTRALSRSDEWGVPAAGLLELTAQLSRREQQREWEEAGRLLSVRVMIPLGVCVLPAFLVLAVIPALLSMLSSTGITGK